MKTVTLATIHEKQGHNADAIKIYHDILVDDPENEAAILGLKRLTQTRQIFSGVNQKKKFFFARMGKKEQYIQFERWLAQSWN